MENNYYYCYLINEFILYLAEGIEKLGADPLKKVLKNLGGWPVVEGSKWDESNFDWIDALIAFRKFGYSHDILLDLSVTADYRNNTVHIIDVSKMLQKFSN